MSAPEMSTVVSSDVRRFTIVNLKQVNELPLRNVLQTFDKNGDGKIDITELQKIVYWYGLWKYASFGLCLIIMTLVWSTFGITIWAINLTKDYSVTNGVLTGGDEVMKMSVASTHIPLSWASLLDRRHLDSLESLSIDVSLNSGKFSASVYHIKVASYLHANSTYIKLFGADGSRVWVNKGTVVLHHPDAEEAVMVCGAAACNTLAVDVKPEYLQQLVQRSAELLVSSQNFELPGAVDGVTINKAAGKNATCQAVTFSDRVHLLRRTALLAKYEWEGREDGSPDGILVDDDLIKGHMALLPGIYEDQVVAASWHKNVDELNWSNQNNRGDWVRTEGNSVSVEAQQIPVITETQISINKGLRDWKHMKFVREAVSTGTDLHDGGYNGANAEVPTYNFVAESVPAGEPEHKSGWVGGYVRN